MITVRSCAGLALGAVGALAMSHAAAARPPSQAMRGTLYAPARAFVQKNCAACHSQGGTNGQHDRAYRIMRLDTYADWLASTKIILAVVDTRHLDGKVMPPPKATAQPSDAERLRIVEWLERGSPNTADGK